MTARLSLVFSYDKDKQILYYSLLCIYTICSKSVPSSQHRCTYLIILSKGCVINIKVDCLSKTIKRQTWRAFN